MFDVYGKAGDFTPPVRPLHPFINKLRERRYALGISQTVLAKRLGYDRKTLQNWEAGISLPQLPAFIDWANALDLHVHIHPPDKS